MQKLKSNRGACKRFKVTGSGKIKGSKSNRRHILTSKTHKKKRQLRRAHYVSPADIKNLKKLILA